MSVLQVVVTQKRREFSRPLATSGSWIAFRRNIRLRVMESRSAGPIRIDRHGVLMFESEVANEWPHDILNDARAPRTVSCKYRQVGRTYSVSNGAVVMETESIVMS